ncbi:hypothetical protein ABH15_04790 [Methanoculleus taiwanensis]|uniref:Uncharacterized protein n=1 Tax=Methanoculleus taiwanensis TaxID=1550565 RepID=A0A498H238_9EURY|nr:hypothetical protein [Methanoculleus taiwanensis]RXE56487.1 hypothetical protein ABH15_04790 [Methanoculleus taiwanensis]
MANVQEQMKEGEMGPVSFSCYRVNPGERGIPEEDMNTYSVVVLLPDGKFVHQIVWARHPEDVADSIRVPEGTRVIMTRMADLFVWDSGQVGVEREQEAAAAP